MDRRVLVRGAGVLGLAAAFGGLEVLPAMAAQEPVAPVPSPGPISPAQADFLLRLLADAPSHGFDVSEFPAGELAPRVRAGDAAAIARLRTLTLAYARAQHGGRLAFGRYDASWGLRPAPYDAARDFEFALAQNRLDAWAAALPPPFARYRTLRDGLVIYARLAAKGGWGAVPAGPALTIGAVGQRVADLRRRLGFEDGVLAKVPLETPFDEQLAESVKRFQWRHGVTTDGEVGAPTLHALNVSAAERADQIRANMERWRWAPREWPADRLEANIAAATLDVFENNQRVDHMLAAAGRPKDETPILASTVTSIVFNPAWHVPKSIAQRELFKKGSAYLASHGFKETGIEAAPLIQAAGPHSALGQVKFDFQNNYGVYLHDTPSHGAFGRAGRSVSHGCVRLQRPVDLAQRLLAPNPDWPPEKVQETIDSTDTVRVHLDKPIAVLLLYWTAFPDGAQLAFRDDVYGWDAKLLGLVDAGRSS